MRYLFNISNFRIFILILFVFTDYLKYALNIIYTPYICIFIMMVDLFNFKNNFSRKEIIFLYLAATLLVISLLIWESTYTVYSYLGLIPVFWILKKIPLEELLIFFKIMILINLPISFYEYFYQTYLYFHTPSLKQSH